MANTHTTLASLFSAIADAIRAKTGGTDQIVADNFPSEIAAIETGIQLPTLTSPGTAADLLAGKQLIDGDGNIIEGAYTPPKYHVVIMQGSGSNTITCDIEDTDFAAKYNANPHKLFAFTQIGPNIASATITGAYGWDGSGNSHDYLFGYISGSYAMANKVFYENINGWAQISDSVRRYAITISSSFVFVSNAQYMFVWQYWDS